MLGPVHSPSPRIRAMVIASTKAPHSTVDAPTGAPDSIAALLPSWRRSLAARRISPRTIATYATSVAQLAGFLAAAGMPTHLPAIRREEPRELRHAGRVGGD